MKWLNKHCIACHTLKPLDEFGLDKSRPDGHNVYCFVCARKLQRKRRNLGNRTSPRKVYKNLNLISLEDKSYFGGLFDGEGCIILVKEGTKPTVRLQISLGIMEEYIIKWIHKKFGGRTYKVKDSNMNYWSATSQEAKWILICLEPYLKIKKRRAKIALEFMIFQESHPINKDNRDEIIKNRMEFLEQIRKLNRRESIEMA